MPLELTSLSISLPIESLILLLMNVSFLRASSSSLDSVVNSRSDDVLDVEMPPGGLRLLAFVYDEAAKLLHSLL